MAFSRCAAAAGPWARLVVSRRIGRRSDAGFGIIEAVVALALLAIIIAPITHLVVTTDAASNEVHLRAEAADIATQALETAQYQTANGVSPTAGVTTSTQYSGGDPFTVKLDWELAVGGGASNVCIAAAGQPSSRIWTVKATVSWGKTASQAGSVAFTTLVSPALADLADTNAGEIAVPIYNADDQTLETTVPISVSVTGQCSPGSLCNSQTVPGNEVTSETANTGSSGCAVFTNLFAATGESYTVTVTPPSPYVDPNELSAAATASGLPTTVGVSVEPNTVKIADNPNIILAPGALMTIDFQTVNFVSQSNDSGVHPAPYLPISLESSTLLCSTIGLSTCVMGDGTVTGGFNTAAGSAQQALLFPGPTVTGTTPNYSLWAGDQADSNPTYQVAGSAVYGSDLPTTFQALPSGSGPETALVYPLVLNVSLGSGHGTVSTLTAGDAGGGDTFTLNGTSGTVSTGLPLGQFQIGATGTGNVSVSLYVWILPNGVCSSSSEMSQPCSTPVTTSIPVTVG